MPSCRKLTLLFATLMLLGCGENRTLAPVRGQVLYNGAPLRFGSVTFQPASGQPAQAQIQPDGTFELATRGEGAGAVVGPNRVRVTCYEGQDPAYVPTEPQSETTLGRSLIPERYTTYESSGLTVEVKPDHSESVVLELTD